MMQIEKLPNYANGAIMQMMMQMVEQIIQWCNFANGAMEKCCT
jgi:hypothetical protein